MVIAVKKATINDATLLSRLATETFYETYSWYNTPANMLEYTKTYFNPERTADELAEGGTHFFLAYADDEPVGYAKLRNTENPPELAGKKHIEIERVYVYKKYQRLKAGYALMNHCIDFASKLKLDTIWLGVWEKNNSAREFYERVGFTTFGTHIFTLGNDPQRDHLLKYELA